MKYLIYGKILEVIEMIINGFNIEIQRKKVKNINLRVYPNLKIKVSIPENMEISSLKRVIIAQEQWIQDRLKKYENQIRLTKRKYVSGEDHYLNGKRYILRVINSNIPFVEKVNNKMLIMHVRRSTSVENKEKLMNLFYKKQLSTKIDKYLSKLEQEIGVCTNGYSIRKMKNKWGSCNLEKKTLILNVDLAKKTDSEIKYVVIHELLHLIEKKHNEHFRELMNYYCPKWEIYHNSLNQILSNNKIC